MLKGNVLLVTVMKYDDELGSWIGNSSRLKYGHIVVELIFLCVLGVGAITRLVVTGTR